MSKKRRKADGESTRSEGSRQAGDQPKRATKRAGDAPKKEAASPRKRRRRRRPKPASAASLLASPTGRRTASFIVLVASLFVMGVLFYRVMAAFLLPLFLAALLVVMFRPLHTWILEHVGFRPRLAAGMTTGAVLLIVLLPLAWVGTQAVTEGVDIVTGFTAEDAKAKLGKFRERFGLEFPYDEAIESIEMSLGELRDKAEPLSAGKTANAPAGAADSDSIATSEDARKSIATVRDHLDRLQESILASIPADATSEERAEIAKIVSAAQEALESRFDKLDAGWAKSSPDDRKGKVDRLLIACSKLRKDLAGGPLQALVLDVANPDEQRIAEYRSQALDLVHPYILSITRSTTSIAGRLLFWLAIMTLAFYYFLIDGPAMVRTVMRLSPLDDRYEQQLVDEFDAISRAVVVATLLSAFVQGVLAGLGFWVAGIESVFLLTVLTMILALVPFLGAAAVWVPVCVWIWVVDERTWPAVFLALYCAVIVSMSDNLIKPFILHGRSNMHPLLALLSVLGGVAALGPIGILVGPMVVAFFHALLNMLHRELAGLEPEGAVPATTAADADSADG